MLLVFSKVFHGPTGNFLLPGVRVPSGGSRVDKLADRSDQSSGDAEGDDGLLFGLTFQVVEEVVHVFAANIYFALPRRIFNI